MQFSQSLKQNSQFRRLYRQGKTAADRNLALYCRKNRLGVNRLGYTVSGKLGKAVVRNRVRRRLREIYRLSQPDQKQGYDIVLVARGRAVTAPFRELERAYHKSCEKLGLLEIAP